MTDVSEIDADLTVALGLIGGRDNQGDAANRIRAAKAKLHLLANSDQPTVPPAVIDQIETVLHSAANSIADLTNSAAPRKVFDAPDGVFVEGVGLVPHGDPAIPVEKDPTAQDVERDTAIEPAGVPA